MSRHFRRHSGILGPTDLFTSDDTYALPIGLCWLLHFGTVDRGAKILNTCLGR